MKKIVLIPVLLVVAFCQVIANKATLYTTTPTERWVETRVQVRQHTTGSATAIVYTDSLLQNVDGFGGTFNELGWDALQYLTPDERQNVLNALFGADGIYFSWGRTPIGCSDYAFQYYSYNDVKDDYEMRNFSIARDRYILIPYLKEALKIRSDLRLWASPWTPPMWMKINEHYSLKASGIKGTEVGHNRLDSLRTVVTNVTGFNMQVGYLQAYAKYLSLYVSEYRKCGIKIEMLMPQNEIAWTPCWPTCTWRSEDFAIFVGHYLGPQFKKDSIDAEIWLGTINYPNPDYIRTFMNYKGVKEYVKGIGVQWTGRQALPATHKEFAQYPLMITENQCGDGENDWSALENTWKAVLNGFQNGVSSFMYWNMVLDETCKSAWDWSQNTLVIIDRETGKARYTDEYYLMKHLSRFVQPGSRMLRTSKDDMLAFQTPSGSTVAIIYNPSGSTEEYNLRISDHFVKFSLKPRSLNTIVF